MNRRDFLIRSGMGMAAGLLTRSLTAEPTPSLPQKYSAADTVTLGKTGIKTSRLAMGTGTVGYQHHSHQTSLGVQGLSDLMLHGYDNGLRFYDTADDYGSHFGVAAALKQRPRDKVAVLTKTFARDPKQARADFDRYRRELGTDYIDVALMHCVTEEDWTTRYRGVMDVFEEMKQKGVIRAHGCSCHTLGALKAAAKSPWVEVDLVRINPVGAHMDADPDTVVGVIRQMKSAGKAVVGMKILGQGALSSRPNDGLRYALSLGLLDAFTIGAETPAQQTDLINRIASLT